MIGHYVEYHTESGQVMAEDGDRWLWVRIKGELVRARRVHCTPVPGPEEYEALKRFYRERHLSEKATQCERNDT